MRVSRAAALALVLVLLATVGISVADASTVSPVGNPSGASGCQPGGLFGHVSPIGKALIGVLYPDPETGEPCVLSDGATLSGSVVQIWMYTPSTPSNGTIPIGVEEYRTGSVTVASPGPNNTTLYRTHSVRTNVVWSNATVAAAAGEFQEFDLSVPPVFVAPADAENLTLQLLGLSLGYMIATPGTGVPVPLTVGGLIGWLAVMSPAAVVSFVAGFGPGAVVVARLRYVSTGKYAVLFALVVSLAIVLGVVGDFTGFLYWLGNAGIGGLGLLLLVPVFLWGAAFWITVRGKHLKARVIRSPISKSKSGRPTVGATAVRIFGGGETGHEEELVEGLGVGGIASAWHRLLGLRVRWHPDGLARDPVLIDYSWEKGRMDIEGEYAAWAKDGGKALDCELIKPELVWFPWRKSVRSHFDQPEPGPDGIPIVRPDNGVKRDPSTWAHRGFFFGLRHGDATVGVLGSPDCVGPDAYARGVAPASAFGREAQRRGTALVVLNERIEMEAEDRANKLQTVRDRIQHFPGSPEAMEGLREISTRTIRQLFDPEDYLKRLEERGRQRVDYRPPGVSKYSSSFSQVTSEATEPTPPELRGKKGKAP